MKITVDTKVGELIPKGKYCEGCKFLYHTGSPYVIRYICNICGKLGRASLNTLKHDDCPKPSVEEKAK